MELKEEDVVMCTVKKIEGTTVFVDIEDYGPGTIVLSEIAAGRIRNLREYVTINKKIICKVLKITKDQIELSLRRVTAKERDEVQEHYKKEKTYSGLLKAAIKEPEKSVQKIKEKQDFVELFEEARINPKVLEKFFTKAEAEKISKILAEKKEKEKEIKREITLKSFSNEGLKEIKEVLKTETAEISYLGGSRFSISAEGKDFKEANQKVSQALEEIEKRAKEKKLIIEIKEK